MRLQFFFPDSQDLVDPSFDFDKETRSPDRIRQRDDQYPHEVFPTPPYDGMLISKAMVVNGRYTFAQKHRFLREGARKFLRLDERASTRNLKTMGDCGAFTYRSEETPPYTADEVVDFYQLGGFDFGISVDHVILEYDKAYDETLPSLDVVPDVIRQRQQITLHLAEKFLALVQKRKCGFVPVGVAQGWSPQSYAFAFKQLQSMGFTYIALGGLVPMKTKDILQTLHAIQAVRTSNVGIHLLGVTRCEDIKAFVEYGVVSFDSTSPLVRAFKDDKYNYYTPWKTYTAIRIPQVDANPKLKARILAGEVNQDWAARLERDCMRSMREFERQAIDVDTLAAKLAEYESIHDGKINRRDLYREILEDRPWEKCDCPICGQLRSHVLLFRGAERNRRRGFHNLYVFYRSLLERTATARVDSEDREAGKEMAVNHA